MTQRTKRRTASEWAKVVNRWRTSGSGLEGFASSEGVRPATLGQCILVPPERRLGCFMHVRRRFHAAFKAALALLEMGRQPEEGRRGGGRTSLHEAVRNLPLKTEGAIPPPVERAERGAAKMMASAIELCSFRVPETESV